MMAINAGLATWLLTILEAVLLTAMLAVVSIRLRHRSYSPLPARWRRSFYSLARRKTASVIVVGVVTIVLRLALIPLLGIPQPRWNDEFSYLLAAKTFASGRLTNPTHPMWVHFETFHIIQRPTYMSMYPPGQGLVLAAGELAGGQPWLGVLIITAAMCSALCWMLQQWLPPEWTLFGGLLAVVRLGVLSYWMNSYWCPALAATGGALLAGAYARLIRVPKIRHAILLGLGLVILANSRPYEGLVMSLPFAGAMLSWLLGKDGPGMRVAVRQVIMPIVLVLITGAVGTGYYYWRVTGSPFRMAYEVNRETYAVAPYFIFFPERPVPVYHHEVMRQFYAGWEAAEFREARTLRGFLRRTLHKAAELWRFYLGPALSVPLLAFPWVWRDRRMHFPLLVLGVCALGALVQTWTIPHYTAPATALIYLVVLQGMRHLRQWRYDGRQVGEPLIASVVLVSVGMVVLRLLAIVAHVAIEPRWPRGNLDRPPLVSALSQLPGGQLVLVRYGPHHDVDRDWIDNEPDIDHAKIVWARDMGERNQELFDYFPDRNVWVLEGDESPPVLEPYTAKR